MQNVAQLSLHQKQMLLELRRTYVDRTVSAMQQQLHRATEVAMLLSAVRLSIADWNLSVSGLTFSTCKLHRSRVVACNYHHASMTGNLEWRLWHCQPIAAVVLQRPCLSVSVAVSSMTLVCSKMHALPHESWTCCTTTGSLGRQQSSVSHHADATCNTQ